MYANVLCTYNKATDEHKEPLTKIYNQLPRLSKENVRDYHDRLIRLSRSVNEYKKAIKDKEYQELLAKYKQPHNSILQNYKQGKWVIRPVEIIDELDLLGDELHNCVSSYKKSLLFKQSDIGIILKDDKYYACFSIMSTTKEKWQLVEAKIKYNRPISKNKTACNLLMAYCEQMNIAIGENAKFDIQIQ